MSEPPPDRGSGFGLSGPAASVWGALAGLILVAGALPLMANWLNRWTLFAFPLGTWVTALLVPALLFGLAVWLSSRQGDEESEK